MKSDLPQNTNPFRVFYDQDKNKYFRINKMNGQIEPSYKSGKIPAQFDPTVSGASYKNRKIKENQFNKSAKQTKSSVQIKNHLKNNRQSTNLLQPSNITNVKQNKKYSLVIGTNSQNKQTLQNYKLSHKNSTNSKSIHLFLPQNTTIDHTSRNFNTQTDKKNINTRKAQDKKSQIKAIIHQSQGSINYFKSIQKLNNRNKDQMSPSRINMQTFQNQLKKFATFQDQKTLINNRTFKIHTQQTQYLDTSLPSILNESKITQKDKRKSSQKAENTITKRSVNTSLKNQLNQKINLLLMQKIIQKHPKILPIQLRPSYIDNSHKQKQQLSQNFKHLNKQKSIFLQFHPKYNFKQNQKMLQQQKDRKMNFKKLQKLFIEGNNKQTSKIYRSISKDKSEKIQQQQIIQKNE